MKLKFKTQVIFQLYNKTKAEHPTKVDKNIKYHILPSPSFNLLSAALKNKNRRLFYRPKSWRFFTASSLSTPKSAICLNMSDQSATVLLTDNIRKSIDKGELIGSVFLDGGVRYCKPLLQKISSCGLRQTEFKQFVDYLFKRSQIVTLHEATSTEIFLTIGVLQGYILGSLMFILFINDLLECLQPANVIMYADNAIILFQPQKHQYCPVDSRCRIE